MVALNGEIEPAGKGERWKFSSPPSINTGDEDGGSVFEQMMEDRITLRPLQTTDSTHLHR